MKRLRLDIDVHAPNVVWWENRGAKRALYLNATSLALKLDMSKAPTFDPPSPWSTNAFILQSTSFSAYFCPVRKVSVRAFSAQKFARASHEREDASGCDHAPWWHHFAMPWEQEAAASHAFSLDEVPEDSVEALRVAMLQRAFLTSPAFEFKIKRRHDAHEASPSSVKVPQSVLTLLADDVKIAWSLGVRDSLFAFVGSMRRRISNRVK